MSQQWKARMLRRVVAFVVAVVAMVLLGSASHSYFVQQAWSIAAGHASGAAPAAIPLADRFYWAAHDIVGMFLPYSAATSIALITAFVIAGALARFTGFRMLMFGVAGALALFVLFTILRSLVGTVGIFGARGPVGLAMQMAAGAAAGALYARLTLPPPATRARTSFAATESEWP